jgi:hypothetical protein
MERVRSFTSEFYVALGIAILTGTILKHSITQPMDWFFLVFGFALIMLGTYFRFAKVDLQLIQKNVTFVNSGISFVFIVYAIILLYSDIIGSIAMAIISIIISFFALKTRNL